MPQKPQLGLFPFSFAVQLRLRILRPLPRLPDRCTAGGVGERGRGGSRQHGQGVGDLYLGQQRARHLVHLSRSPRLEHVRRRAGGQGAPVRGAARLDPPARAPQHDALLRGDRQHGPGGRSGSGSLYEGHKS